VTALTVTAGSGTTVLNAPTAFLFRLLLVLALALSGFIVSPIPLGIACSNPFT
jgi:hypothetical protein